jgi:hypothetical protein
MRLLTCLQFDSNHSQRNAYLGLAYFVASPLALLQQLTLDVVPAAAHHVKGGVAAGTRRGAETALWHLRKCGGRVYGIWRRGRELAPGKRPLLFIEL